MHITAKITFIHVFIRSSNIWPSYILNRFSVLVVFCSVSVAYAPDCVHELFLRLLLLVFCLFVCLFFFKRNFFLRYVNTTYIHRGSLNWNQLPLGGMTFFVKGDKQKDGVLQQTLKSSCLLNGGHVIVNSVAPFITGIWRFVTRRTGGKVTVNRIMSIYPAFLCFSKLSMTLSWFWIVLSSWKFASLGRFAHIS